MDNHVSDVDAGRHAACEAYRNDCTPCAHGTEQLAHQRAADHIECQLRALTIGCFQYRVLQRPG